MFDFLYRLKPCPKCGASRARIGRVYEYGTCAYYIVCDNCGHKGEWWGFKNLAVKDWNDNRKAAES